MSWQLFERAAGGYEAWYAIGRGRRVDEAERALLRWLMEWLPPARTVLDVGCGTGHFAAWLRGLSVSVIGLDRSPAMLAEMRRRHSAVPAVLADATHLPMRPGSVDLALLVTVLEFLPRPGPALEEAVRVARRGVVVLALNRWSPGGLSRRVGPQARRPLLGAARDTSLRALRQAVRTAAGDRYQGLRWASSLFPDGLWAARARVPLGDVIGMAVALSPPRG